MAKSAPISGRAGIVNVYPGSLVQANASAVPLVNIAQLDPIGISFTVPETQLASLLGNEMQHHLMSTRGDWPPAMIFALSVSRMSLSASRTLASGLQVTGERWMIADMTTAASIIHGMGPQKYPKNLTTELTFFAGISLGPYC